MSVRAVLGRYRRRFRGLLHGNGFRELAPQISSDALAGEGKLYTNHTVNPNALRYPGSTLDTDERMLSALCRSEYIDSPAFRYWFDKLRLEASYHRKLWEFAAICQALHERDLLAPGKRGLGFAVGQEPLPALFASLGATIVATDLASGDKRSGRWSRSGEWAGGLAKLAHPEICPAHLFNENVTYRPVDMNKIPDDLRDFSFTWSSCSFEHCGTIELGLRFLQNQMACLEPGGWAVHTTEFNLSSNSSTLASGGTVLFRRRDIEEVCEALRSDGHSVEPLDLTIGDSPVDRHIDERPFTSNHLRLRLRDWASTSIILIIRKGGTM